MVLAATSIVQQPRGDCHGCLATTAFFSKIINKKEKKIHRIIGTINQQTNCHGFHGSAKA
jgi:hypothetical protein